MALASKPRPARFDRPYGHDAILWAVKDLAHRKRFGFVRPAEIARTIGCTRSEAQLALRLLREWKFVNRRDLDGRWYYDPNEPWRSL